MKLLIKKSRYWPTVTSVWSMQKSGNPLAVGWIKTPGGPCCDGQAAGEPAPAPGVAPADDDDFPVGSSKDGKRQLPVSSVPIKRAGNASALRRQVIRVMIHRHCT